jgi:hypothetical protein
MFSQEKGILVSNVHNEAALPDFPDSLRLNVFPFPQIRRPAVNATRKFKTVEWKERRRALRLREEQQALDLMPARFEGTISELVAARHFAISIPPALAAK